MTSSEIELRTQRLVKIACALASNPVFAVPGDDGNPPCLWRVKIGKFTRIALVDEATELLDELEAVIEEDEEISREIQETIEQ